MVIKQWISTDEVVDRVNAMRRQEETSYACRSYFPEVGGESADIRLNVTWREKICQWSYNVVDHFDLSREVVAVSIDLFDRYLATQGNKCNGNLALLTSLTTLHIAIKLHDCKKIKMSTLANLSRGQFGSKHIEEMEWEILRSLGWKLHPPTQYSFVSHFLHFLPQEASPSTRKDLLELSRYLTELAVCDSFFVESLNSTVAYAALLNVVDDMNYKRLSAGIREKFLRDLSHKLGFSPYDPEVSAARERLRTIFVSSCANEVFSLHQDTSQTNTSDSCSLAGGSISSTGSNGSKTTSSSIRRPRTNSVDSKGSCRYSPSPRRRFVASVSPMTTSSRTRAWCSQMVASVQ